MAHYYSKLVSFTIGMILLTINISFGQGCPNAGFTQGSFNNWVGYTGTYTNPGATTGIVAGRHTVINTPGVDPFTCGGLSVLPPGGTVSCRLGNSNTGSQGERLRYQMTVDATNALFVYKYAVVLENPSGHAPNEQPEFSVRILDQNGAQIGGSCGIYTVYGGQPGQNFQNCNGVTWLPWTLVGVNLSPYIGQTIQVEFTTKDCSLSGHFGYAYISAECLPLNIDVVYCQGSNAVTLTAPTGFQTYTWSSGQTTPSITIQNPVLGAQYSCVLTTFSNQGNCTVTLNAQVFPTTIIPGFVNNLACVNAPMQFTDTSSADNNSIISAWDWDFGDGTPHSFIQNPSHIFTQAGIYTVNLIVTTDDGCMDTIQQTVTLANPPTVAYQFQNDCIDNSISFNNQSTPGDSPITGYSWDFGDGSPTATTQNPTHLYNQSGNLSVQLTVTDSLGCINSLTQPITIFPLPAVSAGPDQQVCPNTPISLSGSGALNYTWNNGVIDGQVFIPSSTVQYIVTGVDVNGCDNKDTVVVTFLPSPVVSAGPDQTVCEGTSVLFAGTGATSYTWTGGVVNNQSFTPAVGTYNLVMTGTGTNGCTTNDTANLVVNPTPLVNAGPDQLICIGSPTILSGSGASTYVWDNNVVNNVIFTPSSTQVYTVTGTTQFGCQATDQVLVAHEAPTLPDFSAPILNGCAPLTVNLANLSSGTPNFNCTWYFGDGTSSNSCGSVVHVYENPGCYDVTLSTTTALGCVWDITYPGYICVFPNPVAGFVPNPGVLSELNPETTMSNTSTGAVSYVWDFGDGTTSTDENPFHVFPVDPLSNHTVELIAISEHGCTDTVTHVIIINEELIYYVPNTFTPDDDEFNQTFLPVFTSGFDPYDFNLTIYNRWGEILFESNNHLIGWDGTYKGKRVQEGTYNWKIEFKTQPTDKRQIATGHVSVLR